MADTPEVMPAAGTPEMQQNMPPMPSLQKDTGEGPLPPSDKLVDLAHSLQSHTNLTASLDKELVREILESLRKTADSLDHDKWMFEEDAGRSD
eukprot:g7506.t1